MDWKKIAADTLKDIKKINIEGNLKDAEREFGSRIWTGVKFIFLEKPEADWWGRITAWAVPESSPVVDGHMNMRLLSFKDKQQAGFEVLKGGLA